MPLVWAGLGELAVFKVTIDSFHAHWNAAELEDKKMLSSSFEFYFVLQFSCIPVCVKKVYSLGKGNIAADALSQMPSDKTANMQTYAEIVPRDVLQVVACRAESQDQN